MKNLISMTDFVLEQKETSTFDTDQGDWYCMELEKLDKIRKYANFLKQPLELWMFISCELVGNEFANWQPMEEHQRAKHNCLFEGFEVKERSCNDSKFKYVENGLIALFYFNSNNQKFEPNTEFKVIEDIVKYNLQLTETSLKHLE